METLQNKYYPGFKPEVLTPPKKPKQISGFNRYL